MKEFYLLLETKKLKWKKVKRLVFKSTLFGDDIDEALQKMMAHGPICKWPCISRR